MHPTRPIRNPTATPPPPASAMDQLTLSATRLFPPPKSHHPPATARRSEHLASRTPSFRSQARTRSKPPSLDPLLKVDRGFQSGLRVATVFSRVSAGFAIF